MNYREWLESVIVFICGVLLISPVFNTVIHVPLLGFLDHVNDEVISHLAFGLVPIIIIYIIDIFKKHTD